MVSTYTTDLRLTKQGTGDNSGTWGVVANNVFQLLEDSIAGLVDINVNTTTGDYTLSTANGATDEARNMILKLTGSPPSAKNLIIPAVSKLYLVECTIGTAVTITIKTASGAGINVTTGQRSLIYCDGLNTFSTADNLSLSSFGITASAGEINVLDGITATTAELNVLDGITATVSELNVLDGITATVSELNVLDGITATVAELNILDGVTATTAELNYLDGVTSNVQTQLNAITSSTGGTSYVLLQTVSCTSAATADFTTLNNAIYSHYEFILEQVTPGSSALWARFSSNGGSSYEVTVGSYLWTISQLGLGTSPTYTNTGSSNGVTDQKIAITGFANRTSGRITLYNATAIGAGYPILRSDLGITGQGLCTSFGSTGGGWVGTSVNAVRFLSASGSFIEGIIRLYGIKK